jgi:putative FmdB family regulatory protein
MPIYEYTCTSCGHTTDILHGINDPTPPFCPECGAEGTLRKAFAPPAIHFKGSGWAKKDRAATRKPGSTSSSSERSDGSSGGEGDAAKPSSKEASGSGSDAGASSSSSSTSSTQAAD